MNGNGTAATEAISPEDYERMKPYAVVIEWSEEDQKYLATAPDLSGCVTAGDTRAEAAANAEEAIAATLASLADRGVPFPAARFTAHDVASETPAVAGAG